jgi:transposase
MAKSRESSPKHRTLRQHRVLHSRPDSVTDEVFAGNEFFDPNDLLQVKYEMLRRVRVDNEPVVSVASAFGFSRQAFYQAQHAFERAGLSGLLPEKRGPHSPHKFSASVVQFMLQEQAADPDLSADVLAERVLRRFDICVHPRSVERALVRAGKKNG